MDASTTLSAAVITVTTVATLIFGPYRSDDNILCNNGTQWSCYCSVANVASLQSSTAPVCLDKFENSHAVYVDFRGCQLNLTAEFHRHDKQVITMENFIKHYIVGLIKQECAMSTCPGYKGHSADMQIVFILLACSNDNNSRLLLNVVQQRNGTSFEEIPAETLARVLTDMSDLLHSYLGSTVMDVNVIKVPRYTRKTSNEKPSEPTSNWSQIQEPEMKRTAMGISRLALIIGSIIVACLLVLSVIIGIMCYRQKRRLRFKKRGGGESAKKKKNSSSNDSSNDCMEQTSKLMQPETTELVESVVYTNGSTN